MVVYRFPIYAIAKWKTEISRLPIICDGKCERGNRSFSYFIRLC